MGKHNWLQLEQVLDCKIVLRMWATGVSVVPWIDQNNMKGYTILGYDETEAAEIKVIGQHIPFVLINLLHAIRSSNDDWREIVRQAVNQVDREPARPMVHVYTCVAAGKPNELN